MLRLRRMMGGPLIRGLFEVRWTSFATLIKRASIKQE